MPSSSFSTTRNSTFAALLLSAPRAKRPQPGAALSTRFRMSSSNDHRRRAAVGLSSSNTHLGRANSVQRCATCNWHKKLVHNDKLDRRLNHLRPQISTPLPQVLCRALPKAGATISLSLALLAAKCEARGREICAHVIQAPHRPSFGWICSKQPPIQSLVTIQTTTTEKFKANSGSRQVSSGLLQLSLDDESRGGACSALMSTAAVHNGQTNLVCGARIMDTLIGSHGTLGASIGRYWSTIRDGKINTQFRREVPQCF
jgi:hypothetical protein